MKNLLIILKFLIAQILSQENKAYKNTSDIVELINLDSIDINKDDLEKIILLYNVWGEARK